MKLDEQYIISGLKNRNKVIFDLVFTFYYSGLCSFANRYLNDSKTAEDLVQDFFVRLWTNSEALIISSSLKAYFFACIKNQALDYLKHQAVKDRYAKNATKAVKITKPDELWEFTETELREIIEKAMMKLPPRTNEIFVMSRFNGFSNDQIAESLNISKRTVEVQISNALKVLRKELKDYLPVFLLLFTRSGML